MFGGTLVGKAISAAASAANSLGVGLSAELPPAVVPEPPERRRGPFWPPAVAAPCLAALPGCVRVHGDGILVVRRVAGDDGRDSEGKSAEEAEHGLSPLVEGRDLTAGVHEHYSHSQIVGQNLPPTQGPKPKCNLRAVVESRSTINVDNSNTIHHTLKRPFMNTLTRSYCKQ
eukprot:GHVU01007145.1.p1 GENE.GHVU01007145.1~~GHVU01007145.1.p1  ORF type:complete len:172 (+),score=9.33 GHVU01007145.1:99-614(+)